MQVSQSSVTRFALVLSLGTGSIAGCTTENEPTVGVGEGSSDGSESGGSSGSGGKKVGDSDNDESSGSTTMGATDGIDETNGHDECPESCAEVCEGGDCECACDPPVCPVQVPEDGAQCETLMSCDYLDCVASGERTTVSCDGVTWEVVVEPCQERECFDETCGAHELCVVIAGGFEWGNCVDNPCEGGLLSCECGAQACPEGAECNAGNGALSCVTCYDCP
jgi:hypothetical protein